MNFVDATFVRLADAAARVALLDDTTLGRFVAAAYDADALSATAPYTPTFDEFRLSMFPPRVGSLVGSWSGVDGRERTEARFLVTNLSTADVLPRVDAYWRGSITATVTPSASRITTVTVGWADLKGVDAEIIAALGALPANPAAAEAERRTRLRDRLGRLLTPAVAVSERTLDAVLADFGATTATALIADPDRTRNAAGVQVTFSDPGHVAAQARVLPIVAAILIRENFSVAQLMSETRAVRERIQGLGLERPRDVTVPVREPLVVAWVVPEVTFADADWGASNAATPAAQRVERRDATGTWLAREGVALVTVA
jgi:hypothetical protein